MQLNSPEYGPYRVYSPAGLARTLMGLAGGMGAKTGLYAVPVTGHDLKDHSRCFREDGDDSYVIRDRPPLVITGLTVPVKHAAFCTGGPLFRKDGDPMFTIGTSQNEYMFDGFDIRRLMPVECERLMGFPDGWNAELSDNRQYIALGESVMVPIIEQIGRLLV